jgi:3-oxoadipate enol-lactonase
MPHAQVGPLSLFYRDSAPGSDRNAVLFLSGMANDHTAWGTQARALGDTYRTVTYDQRDIGQSSLATAPYAIADLADDAAGLLDALSIDAANCVGWSMGGAVVQELALRHPARVRSLALVATYTSSDPRGDARMRSWAALRPRVTPEEFAGVTWPWVYTVSDYRRPGFIEQTLARVLANPYRQSDEAYARQVEAVLSHRAEGRLGAIGVPTLLLFGDEDILTPPARFAEALRANIPHATMLTIAGAGHGLIWTHAEAVTAVLGGWLGEVAGRL